MRHLSVRDSMKGTLGEGSFTAKPFFFLEPEDIKSLGVIWNFAKGKGLL